MLLVPWAQQTEHCQSHPVWKIQDTETSVSLLVSSSECLFPRSHMYIYYPDLEIKQKTDAFPPSFVNLIQLKLCNNTNRHFVVSEKL